MNFYKQYLEVKKQYPDALVFYRVGDFYELFGADAVTASEALNLTLTGRDVGLAERVPMCGMPYHSIDIYIKKLIEAGHKTAMCEPAQMPKNGNEPLKAKGQLNLTAVGTEQTILKEYLEANASDILIEKINNGDRIVKDGKTLINKKTLDTFMKYACDEAQKLTEKVSKTPGARAACVEDKTVFGWLIHYFEESSIEGTLYNEDGSEYKQKPAPRTNTAKAATAAVVTPSKEKPKTQFSLFDMLDSQAAAEPKMENAEIEAAAAFPETELDETDTDELSLDALEDDEPESEIDELVTETEETPEDEEDYPKGLHQVSETEWADEDGIIYEVTEAKNNTIPDSLTKLFGALIVAR